MEIYLYQNTDQVGPYTVEQIATMISIGAIANDVLAWHEGLSDWLPLYEVVDITPLEVEFEAESYRPEQELQLNEIESPVVLPEILVQYQKLFQLVASVGLSLLSISPLLKWIKLGAFGATGIAAGSGKVFLALSLLAATAFAVSIVKRIYLLPIMLTTMIWGIVSAIWMSSQIWKLGSILDSSDMANNPFAALIAAQISPGAGLYLGLIGGLMLAGAQGTNAFYCLRPNRLRIFYTSLGISCLVGIAFIVFAKPNPQTDQNIGDDLNSSGSGENTKEYELKKLAELREMKKQHDKKLIALRKFEILRSNFSIGKDAIGMKQPAIELTVQNNTDYPVKRAYFRGVLLSPGRNIPWIDDTFNYEIAGGIEQGEKVTWNLLPNMFSDWGTVDVPADAQFNVTVIRLDDSDGTELFGEADFTDSDETRLKELEKKHGSRK